MKVWVTDDSYWRGFTINVRETVRESIPDGAKRVNLKPDAKRKYDPNQVDAPDCHASEQAAREFYEKRRASKIEALRRAIQEWEAKKVEVIE